MVEKLIGRLRGEELRARALRGSAFTILVFGSQNLLRLGSNLILTRLLFPEAFGLMALVTVAVSAVNLFSDIGMGAVVVRSPRGAEPDFLDTAWTVQVLRGIFLYSVMLLLAPFAADFYNQPQLTSMISVAGLQLVFSSFASIGLLTANRELRLGRVSVLQICSQIAAIVIMIALALWLRSVWALVIGGVLQSAFVMLLSHVALNAPRRRFRIERAALSEIFHFGKYIFFATVAGFFLMHGDRAVLGKFVTLDVLALFTIALVFSQAIIDLVGALSMRIVFPLYAQRPPGESAANWHAIARARWMLSLGGFALAGIVALSGDFLIQTLYDPRYTAAGPILVLLGIAAFPRIALQSYSRLATAAGHSGRFATYQISLAVLQVILLILGVQTFGIAGAALAPVGAQILLYPGLVWLARPYGGLDFRHDAVMALLSLGVGGAAAWMHWPALAQLFSG